MMGGYLSIPTLIFGSHLRGIPCARRCCCARQTSLQSSWDVKVSILVPTRYRDVGSVSHVMLRLLVENGGKTDILLHDDYL